MLEAIAEARRRSPVRWRSRCATVVVAERGARVARAASCSTAPCTSCAGRCRRSRCRRAASAARRPRRGPARPRARGARRPRPRRSTAAARPRAPALVDGRPLAADGGRALARPPRRSRAGRIELAWRAGPAAARLRPRRRSARALDNLIANALEHGRGAIRRRGQRARRTPAARRRRRRRRRARAAGPTPRAGPRRPPLGPAPAAATACGSSPTVAAEHGGRFAACAHEPAPARCSSCRSPSRAPPAPVSRRARAVGFASRGGALRGARRRPPRRGAGADAEARSSCAPVVVATADRCPARRRSAARRSRAALELRRVPERFVPPDALDDPAQALGRRPAAAIPAGGYLLASQLARAGRRGPQRSRPAARARTAAGRDRGRRRRRPRGSPAAAGAQRRRRRHHRARRRRRPRAARSSPPRGGPAARPAPAPRAPRGVASPPAAGEAWVATLALTRAAGAAADPRPELRPRRALDRALSRSGSYAIGRVGSWLAGRNAAAMGGRAWSRSSPRSRWAPTVAAAATHQRPPTPDGLRRRPGCGRRRRRERLARGRLGRPARWARRSAGPRRRSARARPERRHA